MGLILVTIAASLVTPMASSFANDDPPTTWADTSGAGVKADTQETTKPDPNPGPVVGHDQGSNSGTGQRPAPAPQAWGDRGGASVRGSEGWTEPAYAGREAMDADSPLCQRLVETGFDSGCWAEPEPGDPVVGPEPAEPGEPAPEVDPTVVALSVIAEIKFSGGTPQIGPPPSVNPWDIAVVGYPYWLWTDGPTSLDAAAEEQGLRVTLDARATSVTFDMGDGSTITCDPATAREWTRAVKPKTKSPTCGYTFTERSATPERPKTAYTVTATTTWEVDWTAGDAAGTEVVQRLQSSELIVGELQALITG